MGSQDPRPPSVVPHRRLLLLKSAAYQPSPANASACPVPPVGTPIAAPPSWGTWTWHSGQSSQALCLYPVHLGPEPGQLAGNLSVAPRPHPMGASLAGAPRIQIFRFSAAAEPAPPAARSGQTARSPSAPHLLGRVSQPDLSALTRLSANTVERPARMTLSDALTDSSQLLPAALLPSEQREMSPHDSAMCLGGQMADGASSPCSPMRGVYLLRQVSARLVNRHMMTFREVSGGANCRSVSLPSTVAAAETQSMLSRQNHYGGN